MYKPYQLETEVYFSKKNNFMPEKAAFRRPFAKTRVCTTKFDFESRKIDIYILSENLNSLAQFELAQFGSAYCMYMVQAYLMNLSFLSCTNSNRTSLRQKK